MFTTKSMFGNMASLDDVERYIVAYLDTPSLDTPSLDEDDTFEAHVNKYFFNKRDVPLYSKLRVAEGALHHPVAAAWAWKHFEGAKLEKLTETVQITERTAVIAAKNTKLTLRDVYVILGTTSWPSARRNHPTVAAKNIFLANLNSTVATKANMTKLISSCDYLGLDFSAVAPLARRLHKIDESIPDEWIERMLA